MGYYKATTHISEQGSTQDRNLTCNTNRKNWETANAINYILMEMIRYLTDEHHDREDDRDFTRQNEFSSKRNMSYM